MENDENKDDNLETNEEEAPEDEANLESEEESDDTDWKAEALKYKSMARRYKQKATEKQEPQPDTKEEVPLKVNSEEKTPVLNEEAVDLRLDGYTREEVQFILKNGGRKALEQNDSFVATAIAAKREQRQAEEESSKAKDTSQMVGTTKKYTPEQLAKMSSKELEKILPHTEE